MDQTIVRFSPEQLAEKREMVAGLAATCGALARIQTADQARTAEEWAVDIAEEIDEIEKMRKAATVPLLDAKRTIDGWFSPIVKQLTDARRTLLDALAAWTIQQREAHRAALQRAAEEHSVELLVAANTAAECARATRVQVKQAWRAVVTDPAAVPREYCAPDQRSLDAIAKTYAPELPPPPIPGVRFELVASTRAARK